MWHLDIKAIGFILPSPSQNNHNDSPKHIPADESTLGRRIALSDEK